MAGSMEYEGPDLDERTGVSAAQEPKADGAWEQQFLDDLVAANRLKTFLVTQGIPVPEPVLRGLATLSDRFRETMNEFVEEERREVRRKSLFGGLFRPVGT